MKLKKDFITQEIDGEQIMVPVGDSGFCGLVRSNASAAFIVDCLKEDTTKEEIVNAMLEKYDASSEIIEESVTNILSKLRKIGALDE